MTSFSHFQILPASSFTACDTCIYQNLNTSCRVIGNKITHSAVLHFTSFMHTQSELSFAQNTNVFVCVLTTHVYLLSTVNFCRNVSGSLTYRFCTTMLIFESLHPLTHHHCDNLLTLPLFIYCTYMSCLNILYICESARPIPRSHNTSFFRP